jgi:hypothetical protein
LHARHVSLPGRERAERYAVNFIADDNRTAIGAVLWWG